MDDSLLDLFKVMQQVYLPGSDVSRIKGEIRESVQNDRVSVVMRLQSKGAEPAAGHIFKGDLYFRCCLKVRQVMLQPMPQATRTCQREGNGYLSSSIRCGQQSLQPYPTSGWVDHDDPGPYRFGQAYTLFDTGDRVCRPGAKVHPHKGAMNGQDRQIISSDDRLEMSRVLCFAPPINHELDTIETDLSGQLHNGIEVIVE